jgi:hypothetical protein
MQYWDNINGTTVWQDTIDAIKAKYPKTLVRTTAPKAVPAWVQEEADAKLFDRQLLEYNIALSRLQRYELAQGQEEVKEMQPTGEQVFNEEANEMEDVMVEVVVKPAIEPLDLTVEKLVYSEDDSMAEPTVEIIENPLITQDKAEQVIADTPQAVIDAYNAG